MNIAILDDHELIRVGVTSVLHDSPHDVTISAACAEELFESLEAGTPCDLLLLDILMPGTNGFEVAKRMRTSGAGSCSRSRKTLSTMRRFAAKASRNI